MNIISSNAIFIGVLSIGFLVACQSNNRQPEQTQVGDTLSTDALPNADEEQRYCFLRTEGSRQQDSSFLQLSIRNETVNGTYNDIPYEKDARRGTVLGKLQGNVFDLVWTFTQEGVQDTLRVVFQLQGDSLLRKPFAVDPKTGREVTQDTAEFSEVYVPVDCLATK